MAEDTPTRIARIYLANWSGIGPVPGELKVTFSAANARRDTGEVRLTYVSSSDLETLPQEARSQQQALQEPQLDQVPALDALQISAKRVGDVIESVEVTSERDMLEGTRVPVVKIKLQDPSNQRLNKNNPRNFGHEALRGFATQEDLQATLAPMRTDLVEAAESFRERSESIATQLQAMLEEQLTDPQTNGREITILVSSSPDNELLAHILRDKFATLNSQNKAVNFELTRRIGYPISYQEEANIKLLFQQGTAEELISDSFLKRMMAYEAMSYVFSLVKDNATTEEYENNARALRNILEYLNEDHLDRILVLEDQGTTGNIHEKNRANKTRLISTVRQVLAEKTDEAISEFPNKNAKDFLDGLKTLRNRIDTSDQQ